MQRYFICLILLVVCGFALADCPDNTEGCYSLKPCSTDPLNGCVNETTGASRKSIEIYDAILCGAIQEEGWQSCDEDRTIPQDCTKDELFSGLGCDPADYIATLTQIKYEPCDSSGPCD